MTQPLDKSKIRNVFRNVQKHRRIEQLIRQFSNNKEDIRKKALNQADLSSCKNVLELGCAFGSFTEALKERLHLAAKIAGLDIVPNTDRFFWKHVSARGTQEHFLSLVLIPSKNILPPLSTWLSVALLYISLWK